MCVSNSKLTHLSVIHGKPLSDIAPGDAAFSVCTEGSAITSRYVVTAGPVRRKWVWSLLFAPLWGSLFINFGIGPIVSRTSDPWSLVGNATGFVATAALVQLSPLFAKSAVEGPLWKKKDP